MLNCLRRVKKKKRERKSRKVWGSGSPRFHIGLLECSVQLKSPTPFFLVFPSLLLFCLCVCVCAVHVLSLVTVAWNCLCLCCISIPLWVSLMSLSPSLPVVGFFHGLLCPFCFFFVLPLGLTNRSKDIQFPLPRAVTHSLTAHAHAPPPPPSSPYHHQIQLTIFLFGFFKCVLSS